jgi:repressor LexA
MLEKGRNPSTGKPVIASWDKLQCLARGMEMNVIDLINQAEDIEVQDALDGATPGDRLSNYMLIKNDDAESVADLLAITPEDVHRIISGDLDISDAQAEALASRYKTSPDVFREGTQDYVKLPSNVRPISTLHRQRVPLIGSVAAGEPIYDPEDLGVYVESPVDADAAITIRGDSMTPNYLDGDLVYIKARPDVPEGAVAVVFLDDEATLKHVYKRPTGLTLISDNPTHPPIMVEFEDYANVRIFGVPVGYTRIYKPDIAGKIKKGF